MTRAEPYPKLGAAQAPAIRRAAVLTVMAMGLPGPGRAHVSEQGLVLLLPTEHYIAAGVISVLASLVLVSLAPKGWLDRLFTPSRPVLPELPRGMAFALSLLACAGLWALIAIGVAGPRDPLTNLLTLSVWIGFWVIGFALVGLLGNLWAVANPWAGPVRLLMGPAAQPPLRLPDWLGVWPATVQFLGFCAFYIVDPAPSDPDRLALLLGLYWVVNLLATAAFGAQVWLTRGEAFSVLFALIGRVSALGGGRRIGFPGWALLPDRALPVGLGVFALLILGAGSFDGLKETFWWLARIDVNPLEFPGRSAVVGSSLAGLVLACAALLAVFTTAIAAGARLARIGAPDAPRIALAVLFARFAPTVLPIALGYHISHFLIAFLVDGQYLLAALGDPLARGANLLGLGDLRVTTGFLNTPDSVRLIWLSQAGIVVAGHILSVMASHHAALRLFGTQRRAALSQLPIGAFMLAYTLFGLWLLASPRGV